MSSTATQEQIDTIYVDIWSDIVCPFCYIGKRHFEQAVEQASLNRRIKVVWHSFELAPDAVTSPDASVYEVLGIRKGWSLEQSKQIHQQMEQRATQAGLHYDFSKTVPANSRNAHRLLHLAHKFGVQDAVKELLLKGYFTDGRNIDDLAYLQDVAAKAGIPAEELRDESMLAAFDTEVQTDIQTAQKLGIQGVPFFVLNQQYAVSGAQPVETFVAALKQINEELDAAEPVDNNQPPDSTETANENTAQDADGEYCGPDTEC
jgi:predicted DsbA family dithiol-disulfide isomerase